MVFKTFFKACAKLALYMTAGFLGGLLVATVIAVIDGDPAPKAVSRCPATDVDDYHFQKLETFVDPRDSNEYTVLKFAEYRGCTMSERDPGFLAGACKITRPSAPSRWWTQRTLAALGACGLAPTMALWAGSIRWT